LVVVVEEVHAPQVRMDVVVAEQAGYKKLPIFTLGLVRIQ
jgi:hypothetical protein